MKAKAAVIQMNFSDRTEENVEKGARLIKQAAVTAGMNTLLGDALAKAIFGQTTIEEVLRVAYE